MSILQSLFPALHQRQHAKRYNRMVELADRVENTRRKYSNQTIAKESAFQVWVNDTNTHKVMRTLGRNLGALQREYAEYATKQDAQKLAEQVGDLQALGAAYAQNSMNGVSHTFAAKQIAATMQQQIAERKALTRRDERSDAHRFELSARETISSAIDSIPTQIVMPQLDHGWSKSEKMKVGRVWNSVIDDVGRLVATYYGGPWATQAIDAVRGWDQKRNQAWAGTQNAYDRIYGPGVKQIGSYNQPDLTGLVSMAGSLYSGGQAAGGSKRMGTVSGIHGTKPSSRGGFSWGFQGGGGASGRTGNGWAQWGQLALQTFIGGRR